MVFGIIIVHALIKKKQEAVSKKQSHGQCVSFQVMYYYPAWRLVSCFLYLTLVLSGMLEV